MLTPSLLTRLELRKEIQLLDDNTDKSSYVMEILSTNFFIVELTVGECDTLYRYFFSGELNLKKLYTIFK
jgi:hypothetical protein